MRANVLTEERPSYEPAFRWQLAAALERQTPMTSMETGRTYFRVLVGPDAMQAIIDSLRGN